MCKHIFSVWFVSLVLCKLSFVPIFVSPYFEFCKGQLRESLSQSSLLSTFFCSNLSITPSASPLLPFTSLSPQLVRYFSYSVLPLLYSSFASSLLQLSVASSTTISFGISFRCISRRYHWCQSEFAI